MPTHSNYTYISRILKQCQNCLKSESTDSHLLLCSACKRAHYCSIECQKSDWKSHKPRCTINKNSRSDIKKNPENSAMGVDVAKVDEASKKWVQQYRGLLYPVAYVAMGLRKDPGRRFTHFLNISLQPNFTAEKSPRTDKDIRKAFSFEYANICPWDVMAGKHLSGLKKAQEGIERLRDKQPQSIGCCVVVVISGCSIARIVPVTFEITPPEAYDNVVAPGWMETLERRIAAGARM